MVMSAIAGHDKRDSTSLQTPVPAYESAVSVDVTLSGLRVGVPREYFPDDLDADVRRVVTDALDVLARNGAKLVDISLPSTEVALSCYYIIAPCEAMSNLARYDGVRYGTRAEADDIWQMFDRTRESGFGPEVKRRILLGAFALSKGYY
jgi:aspartyl-tRNA(Asn)/glutamyl-tRNA(Gln) amidotransferase subunit A